jgi:hypothetical protein
MRDRYTDWPLGWRSDRIDADSGMHRLFTPEFAQTTLHSGAAAVNFDS